MRLTSPPPLMFIATVMILSALADRKASQGKATINNEGESSTENPEKCCGGGMGPDQNKPNDRGSGVRM